MTTTSQLDRPRAPQPLLEGVLVALLVFLASGISIASLFFHARDAQANAVKSELERLAQEAAARIDSGLHDQLRRREQQGSELYEEALTPLLQFHQQHPELFYVYTTIQLGDDVHFVLDTANRPDLIPHQEPLLASSLMDEYAEPDSALVDALNSGRVTSNPQPYTDELGTFMSGFAPIRNHAGTPTGVVGVDLDISGFLHRMAGVHRATWFSALIALAIACVSGLAVAWFRQAAYKRYEMWRAAQIHKEMAEGENATLVRTLSRNVRLLRAASDIHDRLLSEPDYQTAIYEVMRKLGEAAQADVVSYLDAQSGNDATLALCKLWRWAAADPQPTEQDLDVHVSLCCHESGISPTKRLTEGTVHGHGAGGVPPDLRPLLANSAAQTVFFVPVKSGDDFEGLIVFENHHHRDAWNADEGSIIRSVAANLGSVILQQRTHNENENHRALLRSVLDSAMDSVIVLRAIREENAAVISDFEVILANPSASELLMRDETSLVGTHLLCHLPPPNRAAILDHLQKVVDTGQPYEDEQHLTLGNFSGWIRAAAVKLDDGVALTLTDVTARKEVEAAIVRAKEAAEAADKAKSEFLAVMSHEIRTPMNGVIGFTTLLQDTPLNSDQKDFVETIRRSGETLVALINDILDFSKIEAGRIDLEQRPFSVRDCLDNVVFINRHAATVKDLDMSIDIDEQLPEILEGDSARLQQILINLVGNAVKFTNAGSVHLRAELAGSRREGNSELMTVRFSVCDTGIGIPADKIDRLFKPFSQADSSTTRRFGGTGLGLAICRRLCNLMGGDIGVESEPNRGSNFYFTIVAPVTARETPATARSQLSGGRSGPFLPRPPPPPARPNRVEAPPPPPVAPLPETAPVEESADSIPAPLSILVTEDNPVNQRIIKLLLRKLGYNPVIAENGREALERLSADEFDLILMDVQMPYLDGYSTTREIRRREIENPDRRRTFICALTADAMEGDRERCLESGMDEYLSKPIDPDKIVELLGRLVSMKTAAA